MLSSRLSFCVPAWDQESFSEATPALGISIFKLILVLSLFFVGVEATIPARAAQPAPLFYSPSNGASITDGYDLAFSVVPVTGAGGFGGGYLWAISQGNNEIWENWRDAHTLDGPTWTLSKGSPGYNAIPKDAWVDVAVRALINGEWTDQGTIKVFVAHEVVYHSVAATVASSHYAGKAAEVNFDATLIEPENVNPPDKYANYCGPAATRALLSAWTHIDPYIVVPTLDAMGTKENIDPMRGVNDISYLVKGINDNLDVNSGFYQSSNAETPDDLADKIGFSIFEFGVPVIVGLRTVPPGSSTPSLNGWCYNGSCYKGKDGYGPLHIVMVYGFDFRSANNPVVKYFEPAGYYAGCHDPMYCPGKNTIAFSDFWTLVTLNNFVISGYPDICPGPNCTAR